MRWRMIGVTLVAVGAMMLMALMNVVPAQGATPNAPQLAPSPRPPVRPTSKPEHNNDNETSVDVGRITGTIIESSTGAPSPSIKVNVGGVIVVSDANGNYERYVPAGVYTVTLALDAGQGQPDQPTQAVQVTVEQVTIQHLYYTRSGAAPAPAPPAPTTAPAPPAPTTAPTTAPAAPPAPTTAPAPQPPTPAPTEAAGGTGPIKLPVTGEGSRTNLGVWLAGSLALIVFGGLLALRPRRRS